MVGVADVALPLKDPGVILDVPRCIEVTAPPPVSGPNLGPFFDGDVSFALGSDVSVAEVEDARQ
jgi:hypothetical protein